MGKLIFPRSSKRIIGAQPVEPVKEAPEILPEPPTPKIVSPVVKSQNPEPVVPEPAPKVEENPRQDSSTVIRPALRDSRAAFERVNEFLCESGDDRVLQIRESDLKILVTEIISKCDANYVRRENLRAEVEKILQSMVKRQPQ